MIDVSSVEIIAIQWDLHFHFISVARVLAPPLNWRLRKTSSITFSCDRHSRFFGCWIPNWVCQLCHSVIPLRIIKSSMNFNCCCPPANRWLSIRMDATLGHKLKSFIQSNWLWDLSIPNDLDVHDIFLLSPRYFFQHSIWIEVNILHMHSSRKTCTENNFHVPRRMP